MNTACHNLNRSLWLDAVRGIAVLMIVLYHFSEDHFLGVLFTGSLKFPASMGMFGVDLFYVLSGFFITKAVLGVGEWNPGKFLFARATRIYPAYIACLLPLVMYDWLSGKYSGTVAMTGAAMHLLMLHNFLPGVPMLFNGVFWTLGVEFPYYLLMALVGGFIRNPRGLRHVFWLAIVITLVFRCGVFVFVDAQAMGGMGRFFAATQIPGVLDAFALGGMAYVISRRDEDYSRIKLAWVLVAGSILVSLAIYYIHFHLGEYWSKRFMVVIWRTWLALGFAILILAAAKSRMAWIRWSGLPGLGKIGFSCYLWHYPVITIFGKTSAWLSPGAALLGASVLTIVLSWFSWRFIEQRFHVSSASIPQMHLPLRVGQSPEASANPGFC